MEWGFGAGELVVAADLAAALEPAARAFRWWEITGEGPFAAAEGLARVRAVLPSFAFRLTFHASFRRVDLAAPDPAARERDIALVAEQLELARGLGAVAMVVHPGKRIARLDDPRAEERSRASLTVLAAKAGALGVELRVENMPRGPEELGQGAEALRGLVEPTTRAACWDLGHARTFGEAPEVAAVEPWIRELHVHDNDGRGDAHLPVTPASAWLADPLRRLAPGRLLVVEHRAVAQCLASRAAAEALLR